MKSAADAGAQIPTLGKNTQEEISLPTKRVQYWGQNIDYDHRTSTFYVENKAFHDLIAAKKFIENEQVKNIKENLE